jgi:hypothetical protein
MLESHDSVDDPAGARKALRRAALLTAGAGIGFGILSIAAWYLLEMAHDDLASLSEPGASVSGTSVLGAQVASLYLVPFAAILLVWFIVALRGWIRGTQRRRNLLISDVQLVSGTVFTALSLVGAGAIAAAVVVAESSSGEPDSDLLLAISGFGGTIMTVMGVRIGAIFVIATASLGITTGALPRWFSLVSYLFGAILMLTPFVSRTLIVAFPIWVIVMSLMLLNRLRHLDPEELSDLEARYEDGESD